MNITFFDLAEFALEFRDGSAPHSLPRLTQAQRLFFEETLKTVQGQNFGSLTDLLYSLNQQIKNHKVEAPLKHLEELADLLTNQSLTVGFCKVAGPVFLLEYASNPKMNEKIKEKCLSILTSCAQNNPTVQKFMSKFDFVKLAFIARNTQAKLRLRALSSLGAIIKGNSLVNKRIFLSKNGLNPIIEILKTEIDEEILTRALYILKDLFEYGKYLFLDVDVVEEDIDPIKHKSSRANMALYESIINKNEDVWVIMKKMGKLSLESLPDLKKHGFRIASYDCLIQFREFLDSANLRISAEQWREMLQSISKIHKLLESNKDCEILGEELKSAEKLIAGN